MAKESKRSKELRDSFVRSEGAEAFVRAHLMLEYGVITSMASRNMPDCDLIAHNFVKKIDCRISVKYRKAKNSDGFRFRRISNFEIFVGILGNRGKIGKSEKLSKESLDAQSTIFILTRSEVAALRKLKGKEIIIKLSKIKNNKKYLFRWDKILKKLDLIAQ